MSDNEERFESFLDFGTTPDPAEESRRQGQAFAAARHEAKRRIGDFLENALTKDELIQRMSMRDVDAALEEAAEQHLAGVVSDPKEKLATSFIREWERGEDRRTAALEEQVAGIADDVIAKEAAGTPTCAECGSRLQEDNVTKASGGKLYYCGGGCGEYKQGDEINFDGDDDDDDRYARQQYEDTHTVNGVEVGTQASRLDPKEASDEVLPSGQYGNPDTEDEDRRVLDALVAAGHVDEDTLDQVADPRFGASAALDELVGAGHVDHDTLDQVREGLGLKRNSSIPPDSYEAPEGRELCPTCGGAGEVNGDTCEACGGSGTEHDHQLCLQNRVTHASRLDPKKAGYGPNSWYDKDSPGPISSDQARHHPQSRNAFSTEWLGKHTQQGLMGRDELLQHMREEHPNAGDVALDMVGNKLAPADLGWMHTHKLHDDAWTDRMLDDRNASKVAGESGVQCNRCLDVIASIQNGKVWNPDRKAYDPQFPNGYKEHYTVDEDGHAVYKDSGGRLCGKSAKTAEKGREDGENKFRVNKDDYHGKYTDQKMEDCVQDLKAKGHSEESAIKICKAGGAGQKDPKTHPVGKDSAKEASYDAEGNEIDTQERYDQNGETSWAAQNGEDAAELEREEWAGKTSSLQGSTCTSCKLTHWYLDVNPNCPGCGRSWKTAARPFAPGDDEAPDEGIADLKFASDDGPYKACPGCGKETAWGLVGDSDYCTDCIRNGRPDADKAKEFLDEHIKVIPVGVPKGSKVADTDQAASEWRRTKGELTRAEKSGDPDQMLDTVQRARDTFETHGYPDWWSRVDRLEQDAHGLRQRQQDDF